MVRLAVIAATSLSISIFCLASAYAAGPTGPGEPSDFPDDVSVDEPVGEDDAELEVVEASEDKTFMDLYTGYSWANDSNFYYASLSAALNGDWSRRGFAVSLFGAWGDYSYSNSGVPGGKVDADMVEAAGLLGYYFSLGKVGLSAYAGVDWQDTRLSPNDPFNPVRGSTTDFVASAKMNIPLSKRTELKLNGGYSIVNETYWSKAKIGFKFGKARRITIGPEAAFFGNENQNSQRAGAFISFPVGERLYISFAGGFSFVANEEFFEEIQSGGETLFARGSFGGLGGLTDGGYASVSIGTSF